MKNKIEKKSILLLGTLVVGITSYAVFAQNMTIKDDEKESISIEEEQSSLMKEDEISVLNSKEDSENKIEVCSLVDSNIQADPNVPKVVGIDALKANATKPNLPTLPGFKATKNGIEGIVNGEAESKIELIELDDKYILNVPSSVFDDEMVQSFVIQILDYYKGNKYTAKVSGVEVIVEIIK